MQVTGPFDARASRGASRAAALASRIEKASASNRLGSGRQDCPQHREKPTPRLQVELVCQDETARFDPFWDAPRLRPVFAAQLMGQVMPERRVTVAVETAYGKAAPRAALLVDRKS